MLMHLALEIGLLWQLALQCWYSLCQHWALFTGRNGERWRFVAV